LGQPKQGERRLDWLIHRMETKGKVGGGLSMPKDARKFSSESGGKTSDQQHSKASVKRCHCVEGATEGGLDGERGLRSGGIRPSLETLRAMVCTNCVTKGVRSQVHRIGA